MPSPVEPARRQICAQQRVYSQYRKRSTVDPSAQVLISDRCAESAKATWLISCRPGVARDWAMQPVKRS
jgi:hypothetical protein